MEKNMNENQVSRRAFVKSVGLAGATSLLTAKAALAQTAATPAAGPAPLKPGEAKMPTRAFGKTGVKVSTLALGGIFDITANQLILKQALDWGVTYWDTASGYNGGKSETGIGMYFEKNPQARKEIFLVTKADAHDTAGMTASLNQSLERMKTDYVDMFFLHGLGNARNLNDETKAWVEKAKADKKFRFFGFSTHSNMENCLAEAAKTGWVDGIMLKYDFRLMQTDRMQAAVDACAKAGIGLTAMKTQGGGPVRADSEAELKLGGRFIQRGFTEAQAKLKAIWENASISAVCSQMPNLTVLNANIAAALDRTKLTAADHEALRQYASETRARFCAGCTELCEAALAHRAPIGDVMRSLMYHHRYGDPELAREVFGALPEAGRRRLAELDFTAAERACPNRLPIASMMKEAAELFA
jgi:uncharacterized protein